MLNEKNIEQYLFEYHEGTLDTSQKVELMEFLHQHPEWQREFAIWAQVRLHDEPVTAPALEKKILKSSVPQFALWSYGLTVVLGVAAVSALLLWWHYNSSLPATVKTDLSAPTQTSVVRPPVKASLPKSEPTVRIKANVHNARSKKEQIQKNTPFEKTAQKVPVPKEIPVLLKEPNDPEVVLIHKDSVQKPVHHREMAAVSSPPDSSIVEHKEHKKGEAPKKKKKRYKHKISLKPTSEIVPSNSNF